MQELFWSYNMLKFDPPSITSPTRLEPGVMLERIPRQQIQHYRLISRALLKNLFQNRTSKEEGVECHSSMIMTAIQQSFRGIKSFASPSPNRLFAEGHKRIAFLSYHRPNITDFIIISSSDMVHVKMYPSSTKHQSPCSLTLFLSYHIVTNEMSSLPYLPYTKPWTLPYGDTLPLRLHELDVDLAVKRKRRSFIIPLRDRICLEVLTKFLRGHLIRVNKFF